jgi:hypothetical protein
VDVEREIVHFMVGFALVRPGNFSVFNISQGVAESRVTPVGLDVSRYQGSGAAQR